MLITKHAVKTKLWKTFNAMLQAASLSLLSDSNQRPRDYKSRALANWAKEAGGRATHIALLKPLPLLRSRPGGVMASESYGTHPLQNYKTFLIHVYTYLSLSHFLTFDDFSTPPFGTPFLPFSFFNNYAILPLFRGIVPPCVRYIIFRQIHYSGSFSISPL